MREVEKLFLKALSEELHDDRSDTSAAAAEILKSENPADMIRTLLDISRKQKIVPLIYDFLCTRGVELPEQNILFLKHEIASYALAYYQNKYFTGYICKIFDDAGLPYALIKGILLSELYKKPECRRFGDVDILINEKQAFKKASLLLAEHGFSRVSSNGDHHHEYTLDRNGRVYLLELHQNLISSQESTKLNQKTRALYDSLKLDKVLPATLDALYLLLHMLQHLLDAGFGIKLLCDWVLYLEQKTGEIDSGRLKEILEDFGIFSFAKNITVFCVEYLGLTTYPECFHYDTLTAKMKRAMEALSEDIFSGGE
ncbi:MAG: nucleotidyltransferase family protein, partial [Lachnospiraceae bacterium]|nr:nucleotidyltransferase family protein [Lachnospiraceae bacterium]